MYKDVHKLLKEGKIQELFNEFEKQFVNAKLHGYKEGDRKSTSTTKKNNKDEMIIHLLAKNNSSVDADGNNISGIYFQRCYNYGKAEDINAKTKESLSVIHYAIKSGNISRINHVVGLGANILGLPGGINGLVEFAVKPEVKNYLSSPSFASAVRTFSDKAAKIVRLTSEKENNRNSLDISQSSQRRLSGFFKKIEEAAELQAIDPIERNTEVQQRHNLSVDAVARVRAAFRSAAEILREQERNNLLLAVADSLKINNLVSTTKFPINDEPVVDQSSSSSSTIDAVTKLYQASSSSSRDVIIVEDGISEVENRNFQEALRRSLLPEYNIRKEKSYRSDSIERASVSSSYRESLAYSSPLETDHTQCARADKDDLDIDHLRGVYIQAEIENRFGIYGDASSTQSTEVVVSQKLSDVLDRNSSIASIRSRSSTEDSGVTTEENSSRGSGDESEGSSTKRSGDDLQRTPTRIKKADIKGTPTRIKNSQSNVQGDNSYESSSNAISGVGGNSFVARFSTSRRDRDTSQAEWILTRRVEMVSRGTSPVNL